MEEAGWGGGELQAQPSGMLGPDAGQPASGESGVVAGPSSLLQGPRGRAAGAGNRRLKDVKRAKVEKPLPQRKREDKGHRVRGCLTTATTEENGSQGVNDVLCDVALAFLACY